MSTSVFITGASGYIGQAVAIAFRNAGYRVYGLVRSTEKGAHLVRHEVIPVVGDLNQLSTFTEALAAANVVVDTVSDFSQQDPFAPCRALLEATSKSGSSQGVTKTYIYTSGVMVYPDSERVRDETFPLKDADVLPFFKGRIAFEEEVLHHAGVRGIVLRPGWVFGGPSGNGNHLVRFINRVAQDKIVIYNALKSRRWNWVHVTDLADGYVRAAKQSHAVKGEVFNLVSDSSPPYEEIILAIAKVAGAKGTIEYTDEKSSDLMDTLTSKTVLLNHQKATDLLGWQPNHLGVLDELDIMYYTIKGNWDH